MTQQISLFLPSLEAGGAERSMATLAEGFAERGFQVDVVLAHAVGPYLETLSKTIRVVDLHAGRVVLSLVPLIRYLRIRKPNSLITAMDHASLTALLAKKWSGENPRVIVSVHKMMSQPRSLDTVGRRESVVRVLARWLYPDADQIVAVSRAAADDLSSRLGLPDDRIHVIPNPVDTKKVKSMAVKGTSHAWYGATDPVILGVGRLSPEKDFATLIRAFSIIVRSCPSRLIILGDGPERNRLEELIAELRVQDLVDLPGTQPNPYGFMAEAAVLALPSIWESFGRVLVEAMACGTSVVATHSQGGVAEILENGRYGRMVPIGDAESLAQAIIETLDAPETAETLQLRASDYSVGRIVEQYLRLLQ